MAMPDAIPLSRAVSTAAYLLYRLQCLAIGTLSGKVDQLSVAEGQALTALLAPPRAATEEEWRAFLKQAGLYVDHRSGGPTADAALTVLAVEDDPRDVRGLLLPGAIWSLATVLLARSRVQDLVALKFHAWVKTVVLLDAQDRLGPIRSPWAIWTLVLLARDADMLRQDAERSALTQFADALGGSRTYSPGFSEAFASCELARLHRKRIGVDTIRRMSQTGLSGMPRYGFGIGSAACPAIPGQIGPFLRSTTEKAA